MKLLFIGESWIGSSARSLKEALQHIASSDIDEIDEINEDLYIPKARARWIRAIHRILAPAYLRELAQAILKKCHDTRPDILLVYKGNGVDIELIRTVKNMGIITVNVFPDYSPHAYGTKLKTAMGEYDLVVSTKPFHPDGWGPIYGYKNRCVFVPHGYDPGVHYWSNVAKQQDIDVVLAASWRPQYERIMVELARALNDRTITFALTGPGWVDRRNRFPSHWQFPGAFFGRAYGEFLRRGKIVLALVNREVFINGVQQPGDEDTTRTYELAAAGCFFLHQRTPYALQVYDEASEVPMWGDVDELAKLILLYLPDETKRHAMAIKAHERAVPAYSIPARASHVIEHIRAAMSESIS